MNPFPFIVSTSLIFDYGGKSADAAEEAEDVSSSKR
jgi:hypothetical protein